ncbi:MAG: hypothetical protein IJU79_00735 [Desulfovibrionaceae bacterium]|nr:hypothetical protein [Desulfovibrionaceae bacterium]
MKITVKGLVTQVPVDAKQTRVAVTTNDGTEYRILPKAAGMDLVEEINATAEATGDLLEVEDAKYLTVRNFKILDDEAWDDSSD